MRVGVHETRNHRATRGVDHLVRVRGFAVSANPKDDVVIHDDRGVVQSPHRRLVPERGVIRRELGNIADNAR